MLFLIFQTRIASIHMKKNLLKTIVFIIFIFSPLQHISSQNNLVRGGYSSYKEYLSNSPSKLDSFYVDSIPKVAELWKGIYSYYPKRFSNGYEIAGLWGFCDGRHSYIKCKGDFFKISKDSQGDYFIGHDRVEASGVLASFLGVGIIFGSVHTGNMQLEAKSKGIKYRIDSNTGEIIHPTKKRNGSLKKGVSQVVLYRVEKNEIDESLEIVLNDSIKYSFNPNSYLHLYFEPGDLCALLRYGKDLKHTKKLILPGYGTTHFQLSYTDEKADVKLIYVTPEQAKFDACKPKRMQRKKIRGLL